MHSSKKGNNPRQRKSHQNPEKGNKERGQITRIPGRGNNHEKLPTKESNPKTNWRAPWGTQGVSTRETTRKFPEKETNWLPKEEEGPPQQKPFWEHPKPKTSWKQIPNVSEKTHHKVHRLRMSKRHQTNEEVQRNALQPKTPCKYWVLTQESHWPTEMKR